MFNRKSALTMCGVIAGLIIAAASIKAWDNKTAYLTVNRPVALPGVTLGPGTYIFELVDPGVSLDLVRVSNTDRSQIYLTAFTDRIERPETISDESTVTFGEAAPGAPQRVIAWFPHDDPFGHRFVYNH